MAERPTFIQRIFPLLETVEARQAEKTRLAKGLLRRAKGIEAAVSKQEALGREIGEEDYQRRMALNQQPRKTA